MEEEARSHDELTALEVAWLRMLCYDASPPRVTQRRNSPAVYEAHERNVPGHCLASVIWRPDPATIRIALSCIPLSSYVMDIIIKTLGFVLATQSLEDEEV